MQNINLTLPRQGMVFILGKSGSGKTTLLNLIGALDSPSSGNTYINGIEISTDEHKRDLFRNRYSGFVFQEFNLLENETVEKTLHWH